MKIDEIVIGAGRDRKKRGPRPPWDKHVEFHSKSGEIANSSPKTILRESGSMDGTGAIHISEIDNTLIPLEKAIGIGIRQHTLGSVGKKQFSGDIDVALNISRDEVPAFVEKLQAIPLIKAIKVANVVMTKIKIQGYDNSIPTNLPRTGYVQLDFMIGDPKWLKVFYHSPSETDSSYKGVIRTVFLSTIASIKDANNSSETTPDGRPLRSERYILSPTDGLRRIVRTPVPKQNGTGYTLNNTDKTIDGPWKNPNDIAKILSLGNKDNLDSFETLFAAVKKYYSPAEQKKIFTSFANSAITKEYGIPTEIQSELAMGNGANK